MITEELIIDAVTFAIGNPSLSEYPHIAKKDALRRALAHYSQYKPIRKIGKFTTQPNTQQYNIADSYTYLVGVTDVFYGSSTVQSQVDDADQFIGLHELDLVHNEALRVINKQSRGVVEETQRYDYHMLDDTTVALMPTPRIVGDVYFEYTLIKSVNDLKEIEYQDVVDFSTIVSASELASRRNKILQINEPGTGFVMFHSGQFLQNMVRETRERLMNSLGVSSLAIHG